MGRLSPLDLAVVAAYVAGIVALGVAFARRGRESGHFMTAGRSLPGWAVGLSIFGSYVSSISFFANPGMAFAADWHFFVFSLAAIPAVWIATRVFVPFYRRTGELSAYEHLERRFGPWARTYAVVCFLLMQVARMGTIVYLLALALSPLVAIDVPVIVAAVGAVMTLTTLWGGMEAAVWTGVAQSGVLLAGALACLIAVLAALPNGPAEGLAVAAREGKFSLGGLRPDLTTPTFWVVLVYGITINLQNLGIDQSYVQRYVTARTDRDAVRSVWCVPMLYVPVAAAFFLVGTALFALNRARPGFFPPGIAADAVFPHFIAHALPSGIRGLVVASVLAAAMDASLSSMATLTLRDLYQRHFRPGATERESVWVLRLSTLAWGALGTGAALAMISRKTALDRWMNLAGILSGGMLGLFLLGLLSRRAGNGAAAVGVAAGVLVICWATFSPDWTGALAPWKNPFDALMTTVVGTLTVLLIGLLLSRRTPP